MEWDILSAEEAAAVLKVDTPVVISLLEANEIPGRIIDGTWRTTRRALVSFVDGVPLLEGACCPPGACGPGGCCGPAGGGRACC